MLREKLMPHAADWNLPAQTDPAIIDTLAQAAGEAAWMIRLCLSEGEKEARVKERATAYLNLFLQRYDETRTASAAAAALAFVEAIAEATKPKPKPVIETSFKPFPARAVQADLFAMAA